MTPDEWVRVGKHSYRHPDGHEVSHDGWLYRSVHRDSKGRRYVARFNRLADAKRWATTGELA